MRAGLHRKILQAHTKRGLQARTYWVKAEQPSSPILHLKSGRNSGSTRQAVGDVRNYVNFTPGFLSLTTNRSIRAAIKSIEKVHRIPANSHKINVTTSHGIGTLNGTYHVAGSLSQIIMARMSGVARSSFVHEYGHYLDHHIFGSGQYSLSALASQSNSAELRPLMRACARSVAVRRLIQKHKQFIRTTDPNIRVTNYLLLRAEIFARAYAQWIAYKSGDKIMQNELEAHRISWRNHGYDGVQWESRDFIPIAREFDNLFRRRGLLR